MRPRKDVFIITYNASTIGIFDIDEDLAIGKFIIPKGTEYYKNRQGEYVSSTIKWTGEYSDVNTLKEKGFDFKLNDITYGI